MRTTHLLATLVLSLILIGCESYAPPDSAAPPGQHQDGESKDQGSETITFMGTVTYKDLEGGFYAIDADNGGRYTPTNLPDEYAVEGLRVSVTGRVRHDIVSFRMYGESLEIISIDPL